ENGAVVGVRGRRHGAETFEVRADVIVGADGRHSTIRRLGGFTTEYEHEDFDVIWFVIDPPATWVRTIYFSVSQVPLLMLPKYPNLIQVGLLLEKGVWRTWRQEGVPAVAERVRRLDPLFADFPAGLRDFTPFFPVSAFSLLVRAWARDGALLIGDAAHTMSPAGAIGVNVALATAAVAAQEIFPRLGHGPVPRSALARVQALRESDVRALHVLQLQARGTLLRSGSRSRALRWLVQKALPLAVRSRLFPRLQRRLFFGAPLPPLDPAFSFRAGT